MNNSPYALMKQCAKCENYLPVTSFSKNKNRKDGLQTQCKVCTKEYKKQHYQTHKAEICEKHKAYRETHKEQEAERARRYQQETHREKHLDYHKQYYANHKEQMLEQMKQRYETHGDVIRNRVKRYQNTHKELIRGKRKSYRQTNREYLSEQRKQYYKAHRELMRERARRGYKKHKERVLEHNNQYRKLHRERILEQKRQYGKTERGRIGYRVHWHKRRAQKRASNGSYTPQQLQEQITRQKSRCYYCNAKLGKIHHVDHVIPLSRGGSNTIDNIVVACPTCNMRKGAKLPHEWPQGNRLL